MSQIEFIDGGLFQSLCLLIPSKYYLRGKSGENGPDNSTILLYNSINCSHISLPLLINIIYLNKHESKWLLKYYRLTLINVI